jgi:hypothetical protein
MEMIDPSTVVRHDPRATFRRLADEQGGVVLHLDTSLYHGVNEIGAAIWELSEDGLPFGDLVSALRERVEDPPADLEGDIEEFVYALKERGLILLASPDDEG